MVTSEHEILQTSLTARLSFILEAMGISEDEHVWVGATRSQGRVPQPPRPKEADQAFMPRGRRASAHFPSMVMEVGVSESLAILRRDAEFWLTRPGNECRLVLVLGVNRSASSIACEMWNLGPVPGRANSNPPPRMSPCVRSGQSSKPAWDHRASNSRSVFFPTTTSRVPTWRNPFRLPTTTSKQYIGG